MRNIRKYLNIPIFIFILLTLFLVIVFKTQFQTKIKSLVNEKWIQIEDQNQNQNEWQKILINNLTFDHNITGYPINIVPNIVHYILFTIHEIQFSHFISFLSVLKNQRPDQIYIHCDCNQLKGEYYKRVEKLSNKTKTELIIRQIERPTEIFGHKLSKEFLNWHSSDITRSRVLMEFGGIYLDRDVYVIKSLDVFRKYEMTLNWDDNHVLGTQLLIAHKNARFLKLWLDSYHNYHPKEWYFNAGHYPTNTILKPRPELIHRMQRSLGGEGDFFCPILYNTSYKNWRKDFYAIHLLIRGSKVTAGIGFIPKYIEEMTFNEINVKQLDNTFGEMCREVLDFESNPMNYIN